MNIKKILTLLSEAVEKDEAKFDLVKSIAQEAIVDFSSAINIFNKIDLQFYNKNTNAVGEYQHNSSINGTPTIYLNLKTLSEIAEEDFEFGIRTTIFHELGHAMVDLDNYYVFEEDENILQFENEEKYVENFAIDFELYGSIPEEIKKLSELFKNQKWINQDDNYD